MPSALDFFSLFRYTYPMSQDAAAGASPPEQQAQLAERSVCCAGVLAVHEETTLQWQIAATDKRIEQLEYELSELEEEEARIIEGGQR